MLNIGLIGEIELLEPFAKKIHNNPEVHISGKSSIGAFIHPEKFRYSIPEFNRVELIERSDALVINRVSLLPLQVLREIVKKSKHIFVAEYPNLGMEDCRELAKLAVEAQTVVQVINPFYFTPVIQWLNSQLKKPSFIDISFFSTGNEETESLLPLLFMLKDIAGAEPKKINAISFNQNTANFEFNNVRLEFGDATTVNINFGKSDAGEFKIRIWALGQEYILNMLTHHYKFNRVSPNLTRFKGIHEFDKFVETITKKTLPSSTLSDYLSVIQTIDDIRNKLARFSVS